MQGSLCCTKTLQIPLPRFPPLTFIFPPRAPPSLSDHLQTSSVSSSSMDPSPPSLPVSLGFLFFSRRTNTDTSLPFPSPAAPPRSYDLSHVLVVAPSLFLGILHPLSDRFNSRNTFTKIGAASGLNLAAQCVGAIMIAYVLLRSDAKPCTVFLFSTALADFARFAVLSSRNSVPEPSSHVPSCSSLLWLPSS